MTSADDITEIPYRDAAVLLIATDSVLWDNQAVEDAVAYAERIAASVDTDPMWANGRHDGDCTQQPQTCARCLLDEYIEEARKRYQTS